MSYSPDDANPTDPLLDLLAEKHGISLTRPSPQNVDVPITDTTKQKLLAALGVMIDGSDQSTAPQAPVRSHRKKNIPKSFLPEFLDRHRVWGGSLQLYELRSKRNWGIGDFEDLTEMVSFAGSLGADFIGLNPLHAPFLSDPDRCSPYEPSNRQMINPLYIAVDKVDGFETNPDLETRLQELRSTDLVDYVRVAETKLTVLRDLWTKWRSANRVSKASRDFHTFAKARGEHLRRHALFETLSALMLARGLGTGWTSWPEELQRHDSAEVAAIAEEHADTVDFHMWLQWLAHQQLTRAANFARDADLRVGLYFDLAVGEAIDGSATWSDRDVYISAATVGSPPDPFAPQGQDWHLAAIHPAKIAFGKNSPYLRVVASAMRYAGAIRIDHAAALRRLFLVPVDGGPEEGAYVDYPQDKLLRILASASTKYRCLVVGEDLGLLPNGLQDDLTEARILSYRILSYEREQDGFKPASSYPRLSLACISTHDHQTLAGWWRGADIRARSEHGIVPPDMTEEHLQERRHERKDLKLALERALTHPPERLPAASANEEKLNPLVLSAHRFIAKSSSLLAAVRLADMTGEKRPTNIPGTSDTYPIGSQSSRCRSSSSPSYR